MNPDTHRTRVTSAANDAGDDAITLSLDLSSLTSDSATVTYSRDSESSSADRATSVDSSVRYVILGEAGRGGMATVHIARDLGLLRKVALKQLADELADAIPARMRFLREVQITAQLDHPYIVPVYGLEVASGGAPAYSMKLVHGTTLADYLQETRSAYANGDAPDEAHALAARIEHFLKICDAVDYAHGKGVIHRDLKPANVMLGLHHEIRTGRHPAR
jgi:serine/threonine-protein kinase